MKNHLLKMVHDHADLIRQWMKGEEILEFVPADNGGGYWVPTKTPEWSPDKRYIAATSYYK
ncbi:MAG: hypothetical protein KGL35_13595 [Bradyrhizobium sp.]|nr:hypothetical protein [Nitrososphaerota archaeon]MDE2469733.1 hypothetical protein [Bradyrhizobium sp.]